MGFFLHRVIKEVVNAYDIPDPFSAPASRLATREAIRVASLLC